MKFCPTSQLPFQRAACLLIKERRKAWFCIFNNTSVDHITPRDSVNMFSNLCQIFPIHMKCYATFSFPTPQACHKKWNDEIQVNAFWILRVESLYHLNHVDSEMYIVGHNMQKEPCSMQRFKQFLQWVMSLNWFG